MNHTEKHNPESSITRRDLLLVSFALTAAAGLRITSSVLQIRDRERSQDALTAKKLNAQIAQLEIDPHIDYLHNYLQPVVRAHSLAGLLGQRLAKRDSELEYYNTLFEKAPPTTAIRPHREIQKSILQAGEHVPKFWRARLDLQTPVFSSLRYEDTDMKAFLNGLNRYSSQFGEYTPDGDKDMRLRTMLATEHPEFNSDNRRRQVRLEQLTLEHQMGESHNNVSQLLTRKPYLREENIGRVEKWVFDALEVSRLFQLMSPSEAKVFETAYLGDTQHPSEPEVFYNSYRLFD